MTDLVERLRAVNPVRACEAPSIDDVWRKLEDGTPASGRDAPRQSRRGHGDGSSKARPHTKPVGVVVSVAVSVVVLALVIVLLGHDQSRPTAQTRPPQLKVPPNTIRAASPFSVIVAALARGVHPPATGAEIPLQILGSSRTRTLQSFRGKAVVLSVFASWCDLCQHQASILEQAQTRLRGQPATVLGVTYEDHPAASQQFIREHHITYPVLRDVTGRFVRKLEGDAVPETFVIDQRGRIVAARDGPVTERWLTRALARVLPG